MVIVHQATSNEVEINPRLLNGREGCWHLLDYLFALSSEGMVFFDRSRVEDGHRLDFHAAKCLDEIIFYIVWGRRGESLWMLLSILLPRHPILDKCQTTLQLGSCRYMVSTRES